MTETTLITIQPSNSPDGTYDVQKPQPYPFHVNAETGEIGRQEYYKGAPFKVLGFQVDFDREEIDLSWKDAVQHPELIEGRFVVLLDTSGNEPTIVKHMYPVESVKCEKYTTPRKTGSA